MSAFDGMQDIESSGLLNHSLIQMEKLCEAMDDFSNFGDLFDIPTSTFQSSESTKKKEKMELPPIQIVYPECPKGGFHLGEPLNLVCVQNKCVDRAVICSICYQEQHRGHNIKPLRLVIEKSRRYFSNATEIEVNTNTVKQKIEKFEGAMNDRYGAMDKYILDCFTGVKSGLKGVHEKIKEQVNCKISNKEGFVVLDKLQTESQEEKEFAQTVKALLSYLPVDIDVAQYSPYDRKNLETLIKRMKAKLEDELEKQSSVATKELSLILTILQKASDNFLAFTKRIDYKFSSELHHTGIVIQNPYTVKSTSGYIYHFAVMEPSLEEKGLQTQKVAFKILENHNSWVAVGLCHKNTVVNNGFNFSYSGLGHGGYLISSNGGSWSTMTASQNNVVTSFNFFKNDIIEIIFDPSANKVVFNKAESQESHTIDIELKDGDQLHLCALFYYSDDKVQFVSDYEE